MRLKTQHILLLAIAFTVTSAQAATFGATFWSVPASTADNVPTFGNEPGPGAVEWGTFDATAIDFSADAAGNYNLGGFLNSFGAASNITYLNGAGPATSMTDVLFEFTGTAIFANGQTFSVVHDDGLNMYVDGILVLGQPGPTAPITSTYTYTGPSGNQSFVFIYANGPPTQADFQTTLVTSSTVTSSSPEPAALVLSTVGLIFLLTLRRFHGASLA